jgi:GNAT superfamily N-acetyltransferase
MTASGKELPHRLGDAPLPAAYARRVRLFHCDRWRAEAMREALADLHVACFQAVPGAANGEREAFLDRLADNVRQPGFSMMVAEAAALQGCAYGFPVARDGSWWQGFRGALPEQVEQSAAAGRVFALAEVMVHPRDRDHDLARQLLERLLAGQRASFGVTLTDESDREAYESFQAWGWREIGEARWPANPLMMRVMVRELGGRSTARPAGPTHDAGARRSEPSPDSGESAVGG